MEYEPDYAKGEILVFFRLDCGQGFASDFGQHIGYKLSTDSYDHGDAFIFKTEVGKEDEAIKKFTKYSEFISGAEFRDLEMERRWEGLERVVDEAEVLRGDVALSNDVYNQGLDKIIVFLKGLRKQ